ncbi:MAG: AsmA family protein [Hyphomicrobiaceae bacterium]
MNRVLLAIGGLLVGLLATLFAAPAMVDWNRYRGVLEEEATRLLGREVRIGGKVNLRLLPVPYVRFEQVRVADTQATVGRPLFMADDFTVWLSVGALLSGAIEAKDIELRKPTVTLVLDGKGGGNWASLSREHFRGSYVPAKVAFDAVRITNGTLAILGPDGTPRTKFEAINGELSAQALEGPYRLAANFALGEAQREIRLSTAQASDDGSVRFKGTVRDPGSGVSYSLEGDAHDILTNVRVTGQVTARLPLPASLLSKSKGGGLLGGGAGQPGGDFDLRAMLEGDTKGFKLSDLALSFEQEGRPQLATGEARVAWADQTDISLSLKSHWLDLDRIAGAGTGGTPLELTQGVVAAVSRILATEGRTEAALTIDQATLGGEVVSNLSAVLEHRQGKMNVKSLSAALPGGARLVASGTFDGKQPDIRYNGRVSLRGASMARFAGWVARDRKLVLPTRDGAFTLAGDLSLGSRELGGRNLTLEVGHNMLTGDASWKAGQPQQIGLNLEGSELDLSPLVPSGSEPAGALRDLIAALAGVKDSKGIAVGAADAEIKLSFNRLIVGSSLFSNALIDLRIAGGNLSMPQLKVASSDGYELELKGDIVDLARSSAKGALTGLAIAENAKGVAAIARIAGLPAELVPDTDDSVAMAPVRLAGRLQVGRIGPDTFDLALDGTLAGSRLAGTLRLGKLEAGWRDRPVDFAASLEGEAARRLLARVVGGSPDSASDKGSGLKLSLRGLGTANGGIATLAAVDAQGISGEYRGRASLDDKGELGLEGDLSVSFKALADGLALAGLPPRRGLDGPVAGNVHLERRGRTLKVATSRLSIGGTEASGQIAIETTPETSHVTGELRLASGSLQGFLALLGSGAGRQQQEDGKSPWSEAAIDLSAAERLAGSRVKLEVARLALGPGLEVGEARIDLIARPTGLDVRLGDAKALGGQASGVMVLEKAPAGVSMTAEGGITGVKLERLSQHPNGTPTALGGLTATLKVKSAALSSRGLVVAMTGGGELRLSQARLNRLTPTAVATAADAVLALKGEIPAGALRAQLELALQSQGVAIGSPRLSMTVADGALRTQPLVVNAPQGRLTGRLAVDLDHLLVDGEWRMEPRNSPQPQGLPPKPELPAVTLNYAGHLSALGTIEPKLDLEALEREVVVRKVEREVAELERLRKLDEKRVQDEAARQANERLEAEKRRLEELKKAQQKLDQSQTEPAPSGAPTAAPQAQGTASPQAPLGQADAGAAPVAPAAVERAPLPRPSPPPSRTKAPRRDPFNPLRENSP